MRGFQSAQLFVDVRKATDAATRARLAELSTPLMPITEPIMVMSLIGTVDHERAAQ